MTTHLETAAQYAEEHKVFQLFESLLQDLCVQKPDKPIEHLIKALKRDNVPRVIVAGPPGAQARSLCELLAAKSSLVHVIASDVWRELARLNVPCGMAAKALVDAGKEIPTSLMLELLKEKLEMGECVSHGYVLEGFPADAAAAREMLAMGLLPTRFLHIGLDDAEVVRRLSGRRVDPKENLVYHLEDSPPPNAEVAGRLIHRADDTKERVTERLAKYRKDMAAVLPCFSKVLVEIADTKAGEGGVSKLLDAALPHISSEMPTRAPRGCPRVLLLGGPGAESEALGAALASTYSVTLISALDLLHAAAINGSKAAEKAMKQAEPLLAADAILGTLVVNRIKQDDVRTSGFVLVGYPQTSMQAAFLKKQGVWLRHVVHLQLAPKAAEAAVTGRRVDPVDGEVYHVDLSPPEDAATAERLVTHPRDEKPEVKRQLKSWNANKGQLLKGYADRLVTEDASRPERQLVERLAGCFLTL
jgi:adenylate kinase